MNRPVAKRALLLVAGIAVLAAASALGAALAGRKPVALGIACGAAIALLCAATWLVGALATFEGPPNRFMKATLGLGPVRFLIAVGGVVAAGALLEGTLDAIALGSAFAAAHVLLQVVEADTFARLADATSPYPKARPARFGGIRLW